MTPVSTTGDSLRTVDDPTRTLVRLAVVVTVGTELEIRDAMTNSAGRVPPIWIEELVLQTYLFAGFPRGLNAMREWRRVQPELVAPDDDRSVDEWRADGLATCAAVYGALYDRL